MPAHRPHKKEIMAVRASRVKTRRWLLKLDRIFVEIEMKRKEGKK